MAGTKRQQFELELSTSNEIAEIKKELGWQFKTLGLMGASLWGLELVDTYIFHQALNAYGIAPGKISGLIGIVTAPFLHGSLIHLAANTIPLMLFSWLIMLRDNREWGLVTAMSMLSTGIGTWLIGSAHSVHVGASGLIFGYFGYLLTIGLFQRRFSSILLSLFIFITYGGLIFGMFPSFVPFFVSWEGHLTGFLGGVLSAWLVNRQTKGGKRRLLEGGL